VYVYSLHLILLLLLSAFNLRVAILILSFQIDWTKASNDFKPKAEGKPISAASFRTSITRLLVNYTPGDGVSMGTPASRKRKAVTASASPAVSTQDTTARKRTKTARAAAAAAAENTDEENTQSPSENNNNGDQGNDETQHNYIGPIDGPTLVKTESQSEWLGNDDMFQGDSSPHLSFLPVS
jgi:hypothetical protein